MEGRPHVLIVDDNSSLLMILSETFRLAGFEVSTARDGPSALESACGLRPDLLILDIGLPGRNGFEVCRALRDDALTENLPIILLTARAGESDRHWGLDAGADEYLTKPFDPDSLVHKAHQLLEARAAGEARNPLTQLPDIASLERYTSDMADEGVLLAERFMELDAESANVFRQKYGDLASAEAIRLAAACMRHVVSDHADKLCVIGHSGDAGYSRFAVAANAFTIETIVRQIRELFEQQVPELYDVTDQESGAVIIPSANGAVHELPLLRLCVAADGLDTVEARAA